MLRRPALKKYGLVLPDFNVNDPKSNAEELKASDSNEAAYGFSVVSRDTLPTAAGLAKSASDIFVIASGETKAEKR